MNRQEKALRYAHKVILHEMEEGRTPELLKGKNGGKGLGYLEDAICFRSLDMEGNTPFYLIIFVIVLAWFTEASIQGAEGDKELAQYCEMVDLHISSQGENGWPDYKKTYDRDCAE